jgi:hypothetical protein
MGCVGLAVLRVLREDVAGRETMTESDLERRLAEALSGSGAKTRGEKRKDVQNKPDKQKPTPSKAAATDSEDEDVVVVGVKRKGQSPDRDLPIRKAKQPKEGVVVIINGTGREGTAIAGRGGVAVAGVGGMAIAGAGGTAIAGAGGDVRIIKTNSKSNFGWDRVRAKNPDATLEEELTRMLGSKKTHKSHPTLPTDVHGQYAGPMCAAHKTTCAPPFQLKLIDPYYKLYVPVVSTRVVG